MAPNFHGKKKFGENLIIKIRKIINFHDKNFVTAAKFREGHAHLRTACKCAQNFREKKFHERGVNQEIHENIPRKFGTIRYMLRM